MITNHSIHGFSSVPFPIHHSFHRRSIFLSSPPRLFLKSFPSFDIHFPIVFGKSKCLKIKSLSEPDKVDARGSYDSLRYVPQPHSIKIPVGDRHIVIETGLVGRQASGAVTVTDGETIVYTSICLADVSSEPSDFFPLTVNYQERFLQQVELVEVFSSEKEGQKITQVLICRLIDRPLRPTMVKGFYHETQILSWVLSYDGLHCPDSLAITAAGIAVALSEVPSTKMVAGVRVGLINDKFIVNPTTKEMERSELDLMLAGTDSAILMIEGYCDFLTEDKLLQAVEVGQVAVRTICNEVQALIRKCGKPKMLDAITLPPPELYRHVEEIARDELVRVLQIENKIPRRKAIAALEEKVLGILTENGSVGKDDHSSTTQLIPEIIEEEDEDEEVVVDGEVDDGDVHITPISWKSRSMLFSEVDVKLVFKEVTSKFLRRRIVEGSKRSDGRNTSEIRLINSRCGLLPRAHGSALFTRGETQSLAVVTLGDKQMAQRIDNLVDEDEVKRFYLQYSFPPSCVGEVGRMGAPSRREIGHGMLAERALEPILPSEEEFPYTIRVESTITESNGSSSMASVCGGCLALLDAGVPVKCSVAGIAMGMVLDTKEFGGDGKPLILSDITGAEDASGDMDFKVAGNENGITAFQMDVKVEGITLPVMEQALLQAKEGRKLILAEMERSSPLPSKKLSKYAPLIHVMKVKPEKVNAIIGSGGKKVKSIIEETGVDAIDTQDDGIIKITAKDLSSLEKSKAIIASLTMVPTVGDIYRNCEVKTIAPYGVFVEIAPGREGLCHISELSSNWLAKAEDVVKVGDRLDVKLIEINDKGQLRLSHRALLPDANQDKTNDKQQVITADNGTPSTSDTSRKEDKSLKHGEDQEKAQNLLGKSAYRKVSVSTKVSMVQDGSSTKIESQEVVVKRAVSTSKTTSFINKIRSKKNTDEANASNTDDDPDVGTRKQ